MPNNDAVLSDSKRALDALLRNSQAARNRSVALIAHATATRAAVGALIEQSRANCAALCPPKILDTEPSVGVLEIAAKPGRGGDGAVFTDGPHQSAVTQALVAVGLSEADLPDLADDLIAALDDARAWGDEENAATLSAALIQIGRHWAVHIGPRAAGISLN